MNCKLIDFNLFSALYCKIYYLAQFSFKLRRIVYFCPIASYKKKWLNNNMCNVIIPHQMNILSAFNTQVKKIQTTRKEVNFFTVHIVQNISVKRETPSWTCLL